MSNEIQSHIVQRVKEFLCTDQDLSATELYDLLHTVRSSTHPDKYQDDDARERAEERFKIVTELLQELYAQIQQLSVTRTPTDLVPVAKEIDLVRAKHESVRKDEEIDDLKRQVDMQRWEIRQLKKRIRSLRQDQTARTKSNLFRTQGSKLISTTTAAVGLTLSSAWTILSYVSDAANKIQKTLSFAGPWVNWIAFAILAGSAVWLAVRILIGARLRGITREMDLASFRYDFQFFLKARGQIKEFTETDVLNFLEQRLKSKRLTRLLFSTGDRNIYVLEGLKDYFLLRLQSADLIEESGRQGLQRKYRLSDWYSFVVDDEEEDEDDSDDEDGQQSG